MLRAIVGWVRHNDEFWENTMRRMRDRVSNALSIYNVTPWGQQMATNKFKMVSRFMHNASDIVAKMIKWKINSSDVFAYRSKGRPVRRWDDDLTKFGIVYFPGRHWYDVAADNIE